MFDLLTPFFVVVESTHKTHVPASRPASIAGVRQYKVKLTYCWTAAVAGDRLITQHTLLYAVICLSSVSPGKTGIPVD